MFKKSIREQRFRFYGTKKLNEIVYGNSRAARDPPEVISGDETITRLYTKKATDVRMRTRKKNESGILNQNLCGSNKNYLTWNKDDPMGGGYTFINMAYPGKSYNVGSMFREKDMGNLLQMIFQCDDYFRYRCTELIADSHFGHVVPISILQLWQVFCTCAFLPASRKGISNLKTLSKTTINKQKMDQLIGSLPAARKMQFDILEDSKSEKEDSDSEEKERNRKLRRQKSRINFFEKELSLHKKGHFKVWEAELQLLNKRSKIYLHAVNDSKVVYRMTNRYGALPTINMDITGVDLKTGRKAKQSVQTSVAHHRYRNNMGYNDQSDAKRMRIGLSAKIFRRWPQKLLAKTIEDVIQNAYLNFLLDTSCTVEPWPVFLHLFVEECLDFGENMRKRKSQSELKFSRNRKKVFSKKPVPGSDESLRIGSKCKGGFHIESQKFIQYKDRTSKCQFCGRQKAMMKCRSCKMFLCIQPPRKIEGGISFPANGPTCYQRFHGISSYSVDRPSSVVN